MKNRNIITGLVLGILLLASQMFTNVFAVSVFSDMPNDWSTAAIEKAISNGLLNGSEDKIMPKENLTRAQMAAVISRAFGLTEKSSLANYTDVANTDWYYDDMSKAVEMKVFVGSENKLNPNNNITREEAFVVIARALKLAGTDDSELDKFQDKELVSTWALEETASIVKAGYIVGADGKLNPKQCITRAEFAQLMSNILQNYITLPGTYENDYEGNVIINTPNVTLKNITIKGDLIIGDGVGDGEVTLDGVTITGRTIIRGGGVNSIKIIGRSNIKDIIIARVDGQVRVYTQDGVEIGQVIVDGSDDVTIEGYFNLVTIVAPDVTVTAINAQIEEAIIEGKNSKIIVAANSKVKSVTLSSENSSIEISGEVTNITTTTYAQNATITTKSGSSVFYVEINGSGTKVEGESSVGKVAANADDISVTTPSTIVKAGTGTSGITVFTTTLRSNTTVTTNSSGTGIVSSNSSSRQKLTISDPILTTQKQYDGNTLALVTIGELTGVKTSAVDVVVTATATYDTKEIGTDKTITVAYEITGTDADKYVKPSDYIITTGIINKKQLVWSYIEISNSPRTYDGSVVGPVANATVVGVVTDEEVDITVSTVFDTKNIGNLKNITVLFTLSGADAANYIKPTEYNEFYGSMKAKQLTITEPTPIIKEYDGTTLASVTPGELARVVEGDDVTVTTTAVYDTEEIGTNKTITVSYTLGGLDASNYIKPVDYVIVTGEITTKQLGISAPTPVAKEYDGNTLAPVTMGKLEGVAEGEDVTVVATATYDTKELGTDKTITVAYEITGTDADKYVKPSDYIITTGIINKKQLGLDYIGISTNYKIYDGSIIGPITMSNVVGVVIGEKVTVTSSSVYSTKDAAYHKVITVLFTLSGADAANYIKPTDYNEFYGSITAKQLTITEPTPITKGYDGTTTASVTPGVLEGVVEGDDVTVITTAVYDTKEIGTNKTITVSYTLVGLDASNYIKPADYIIATGEITTKQLSISAPTPVAKEYDENTLASVTLGELEGVAEGEDVTVVATATYDTIEVGTDKTIAVTYAIWGYDSYKYIKPADEEVTTGEIAPKRLTYAGYGYTFIKLYDGNTSVVFISVSVRGILGTDDVVATGTAEYDTKEVGTSKAITVSVLLSGADAANYIKPLDDTMFDGVITAKQLYVTGPILSTLKQYDGTTTVLVIPGELAGVLDGDDVTVTATAAYDSAEIGTGKLITVTYTLGGLDASNYTKPADYIIGSGEITE